MSSLTDSLLQENWAWVDKRLEELYYGYGLTQDNIDDYTEAGLLNERWAWVDTALQDQDDSMFEDKMPCLAPLTWVLYKDYPKQYCLEAKDDKEENTELLDIMEGVVKMQAALQQLELKMQQLEAEDEAENDDGFDDCSTIGYCSDTSELIFEIDDDGYDSF